MYLKGFHDFIELPISTTIILRSIAEIAREHGESVGSIERIVPLKSRYIKKIRESTQYYRRKDQNMVEMVGEHRHVLAEHLDLESEDIRACLHFASKRLNHPVLAVSTQSSTPAARCCAP